MTPPAQDAYQIGWICALPIEVAAAKQMLDENFGMLEEQDSRDTNSYTLGRAGRHYVVIAGLPGGQYGTTSATTVAINMMRTFSRSLRIGLMVGIGGGIPSANHDVRLGDIVVSYPEGTCGGVLQYDMGKVVEDGRVQRTGSLNSPPRSLSTAVANMRASALADDPTYPEYIEKAIRRNGRTQRNFRRPDASTDRLFQFGREHPTNSPTCNSCLPSWEESRDTREEAGPQVHYGIIASANAVMKHGATRERLRRETGALCFEMEAAGLMMDFPCIIIRGICDYADSHKNKQWQGYAALAAASYAKELLSYVPVGQVSQEKLVTEILSDIQNDISQTSRKADAIIHHQQTQRRTQEHRAILDWLTPIDYAPQQEDYIGMRQPGTCQWFLDSEQYQTWVTTDKQTLFCPGGPGVGKTILTATVIDDIHTRSRSNNSVGIAYLYCDYRRQYEQKAEHLVANLLKQLARSLTDIPDIVQALYNEYKNQPKRPTLSEISKVLRSVSRAYSKVFILVDALDECQGRYRRQFLSEILGLQSKCRANIFATSRFTPDILTSFDGCMFVEISARVEDVQTYLVGHVTRLPSFVLSNLDLQSEIKATISRVVDGMFLLARLHMDALAQLPTVGDVKLALRKLPGGLNETYEQAMSRIKSQQESTRELAMRVLSWLIHSKRVLSICELQHAVAVKLGEPELDTEFIPNIEVIVSICAGLVTVDTQSEVVRLAHYTTKEYFQGEGQHWFLNTESVVTAACTTYLSFTVFESGFCETDDSFEERLCSNQLYDYAARNWGHHARAAPEEQLILDFLESEAKVSAASQAMMASRAYRGYSQKLPTRMEGIHLAAHFGLGCITAKLLNSGHDADARDSWRRTPLLLAAENGYAAVVKLLVDKGAYIDSMDENGQTALLRASINGHEAIVKLLLENGANIESKASLDDRTSLLLAAAKGHEAIVKLLLENGANIHSKDKSGHMSLSWAALNGHEAIVKRLLENGANIESKAELDNQTPLSLATAKGHEAIVKLLLKNGAYINSEDIGGYTPLLWASISGHEAIVKLLLENGADLEPKDTKYGQTPLLCAALNGHGAIVKVLLENGANVESKTTLDSRTPLLCAARNGHKAIVKLLLKNEALINSKDKGSYTPLLWAAKNGHETVVMLLLENGADLESKDTEYNRAPLSWAAINGHEAIVKLLLEKGADPEATCNGHRLLSWAAGKGYEAIVKLLLENGADLESKDTEYDRAPLSWAAENGHEAIVKLLLKNGAFFNSRDKGGYTPLLWASISGHEAIVKLLLENGADLVSKDIKYGQTPLLCAAKNGHETVVKLLLEKGADLESKDSEHCQSPIWWAALNGHNIILKMLLKNGADHEAMCNGQRMLSWVAETGHEEVVKILLENGADLESKDTKYGQTPLSWAAENGHEEVVKLLLENGADLESKDTEYGQTPLSWAAENGHEAIVKLLLEKGADPEATCNGQRLLSWAAGKGYEAIVKLLLENGANVETKDTQYGWTPLMRAALNGHEEVVRMLLENGADPHSRDKKCQTPVLRTMQASAITYSSQKETYEAIVRRLTSVT